jgi:hypothetical protein
MNKVTVDRPKPLDTGTAFHLGLEAYYNALKEKAPFQEALDAALVATRISLSESDLSTQEGSRILEILEETTNRWKHQDINFEILAVESPFSYVLDETDEYRIVMIGKIDLLVNIDSYENLPIDHKSYSRDFPITRMRNQFINYANACKSNFLLVNRIGTQTSVPVEKKMKRDMLSYDPLFIDQWKKNTVDWCLQYYEYSRTQNWPMNFTSCDKFNRPCEYLDICNTSGEENKVYKLELNFNTAPKWDVSQSLEAYTYASAIQV